MREGEYGFSSPCVNERLHEVIWWGASVEPTMPQHVVREKPALRIAVEHRKHEILEKLGLRFFESVFGYHDIFQWPIL